MASAEYETFLAGKAPRQAASGITVAKGMSRKLFPWQAEITKWALRKGRAAVFAGTGLGKTFMQVEAAKHIAAFTGLDVLILAPLAVAQQTVREAAKLDIHIRYCRHQSEVQPGITITNYDMLEHLDPDAFVGVILDESSCIKHQDAARRTQILEAFHDTPFRLAFTATPAPNDYVELGNHAEFLGVMRMQEMLATYFVHDGGSTQDWRLKGHAQGAFWQWLASWSVMLRKPSDLGYENGAFNLPPLTVEQHIVEADHAGLGQAGMLFAIPAHTLSEQRIARRSSITARVEACAAVVRESSEPWLIWCDLNDEADSITALIPGAVQVAGKDSIEDKAARMQSFSDGSTRVLVSKATICGWGMNWQHCAHMAFVGVGYSWESYYQAIRRCWRFGQTRPVEVHVFISELEGAVLTSLTRKEEQAQRMADALVEHVGPAMRATLGSADRQTIDYNPQVPMRIPSWLESEAA